MNRFLIAAAIAAVPLAAVQAQAPMDGAAYVKAAGASDKYEIESSKLVLQTTQNANLKAYANMMVGNHTKSTGDVAAAAAGSGITPPPPALDAVGTRNVTALRVVRGTARDRLYVIQQRSAHQKALALHQGYAANGTVPALKNTAGMIVPVVQHHIEMLAAM